MPVWISRWQSISFNERLCLISRCRAKGLTFPRHFYQHIPENEALSCGFPGIKSPARKGWRGLSTGVWQQTNTRWESVILFPLNKHYTHFFSTGWWGNAENNETRQFGAHLPPGLTFSQTLNEREERFPVSPLFWLLWPKSLRVWQGTERLTRKEIPERRRKTKSSLYNSSLNVDCVLQFIKLFHGYI